MIFNSRAVGSSVVELPFSAMFVFFFPWKKKAWITYFILMEYDSHGILQIS